MTAGLCACESHEYTCGGWSGKVPTKLTQPASWMLLLVEIYSLVSGLPLPFPHQARYFNERGCHEQVTKTMQECHMAREVKKSNTIVYAKLLSRLSLTLGVVTVYKAFDIDFDSH